MKNFFVHYHPAAIFLYIACAIVSAMVTFSPTHVAIAVFCSCLCSLYMNGAKKFLRGLRLLALLFTVVVVATPLTNHRGATPLFLLPFGPVTLEALAFGLSMGGMLLSVFVWFQCYQKLITNDKFLFLFGHVAPTSAMVVSMIIKFIPVTGQKLRGIMEAQRALGTSSRGREQEDVGWLGRRLAALRNGVRLTGILMSRCLEDSIETAEAMRAKGYGTRRRTVFGAPRFRLRDGISIAVVAVLFAFHIAMVMRAAATTTFFPFLILGEPQPVVWAAYAVQLLWPLLIELKDGVLYLARTV
ncbi:MAG: energy-coupling factor transporter transmembrane protein EcfT [Clostridiales Family XIII bacterium]|nr:energy-coupling factor transporter transmembrane protein EcfT [Clostridiales Family XIII bacterium]